MKYSFWKKYLREVYPIFNKNMSLFLGLGMLLIGVFGFSSGRYCDGTVANYYGCTNSATYYFYSPLALFVIVFGAFLIVVWKLRQNPES